MAPLKHRTMFRHQGIRPLLQMKLGAFFDSDIRPLCGSSEGGEDRHIGVEPNSIVAPVAGGDHPPVKVEDALQLGTID